MTLRKERALDAFLVASARIGDRGAFEMLVRRWHKKLIAHAWRLIGEKEAARDCVQESWVEIVQSLPALRDGRAFPAWAYRIVSRRCSRRIQKLVQDRKLLAEHADEAELSTSVAPEGSAGTHQLSRLIAALPPEQRSALSLFYLEEMSVAEVAVALDVPVGTVKTRLMHARRKLRHALEGDE